MPNRQQLNDTPPEGMTDDMSFLKSVSVQDRETILNKVVDGIRAFYTAVRPALWEMSGFTKIPVIKANDRKPFFRE